MATDTAPPLLWEPPPELVERATITRFMRAQDKGDYHELWQWSVDDVEGTDAACNRSICRGQR